jgi:hypothetical protein
MITIAGAPDSGLPVLSPVMTMATQYAKSIADPMYLMYVMTFIAQYIEFLRESASLIPYFVRGASSCEVEVGLEGDVAISGGGMAETVYYTTIPL